MTFKWTSWTSRQAFMGTYTLPNSCCIWSHFCMNCLKTNVPFCHNIDNFQEPRCTDGEERKTACCLSFVLVYATRHASTCNILLRGWQTRSLQFLICVSHSSLIPAYSPSKLKSALPLQSCTKRTNSELLCSWVALNQVNLHRFLDIIQ